MSIKPRNKEESIPFHLHDFSEEEISEISKTLRTNWVSTGPRTRDFETALREKTGSEETVCLNSATAGLFLGLKIFGIGPGDEVITSAYTYSASAAAILHTGATPVLADCLDDFNIDPASVEKKITPKTKAIIPVDIGGLPCDYVALRKVIAGAGTFQPRPGTFQEKLGRILILADASHAILASSQDKPVGSLADLSAFSFQVVKNLTTIDGGALTVHVGNAPLAKEIADSIRLWSLHGQSKSALEKMKPGGWRYDILVPGYKFNMTDVDASLGLIQLRRQMDFLKLKKKIIGVYDRAFAKSPKIIFRPKPVYEAKSSEHLYMIRLAGKSESERDALIAKLAEEGIALNVHYIPLPLFTLYRELGHKMDDTPNAFAMYQNEVSLPLYSKLRPDQAERIASRILESV